MTERAPFHPGLTYPEELRVPLDAGRLEGFRRWARSDEFPENGKITYLAGEIDIDMSPEEGTSHGTAKVAIVSGLQRIVFEELEIGLVFSDRMRLSSEDGELSAEPDALVLLYDTLDTGRARTAPKAGAADDKRVEIEGTADIVVECVSDSSVRKDLRVLPGLYHEAGVTEYWVVDARKPEIAFTIHHWAADGYRPATADADGFTRSRVLDRAFRLVRREKRRGSPGYKLEERP